MIEVVSSNEEIENLYKSGSNAPYTALERGYFGYVGVLLARKEDGKVQCHICGEWKEVLNSHITKKHKMRSPEYKKKFGFPRKFPLCSVKASADRSKGSLKAIANGNKPWLKAHLNINWTPERLKQRVKKFKETMNSASKQNSKNICHDQVLRRITVLADQLGHFPSSADMQIHDWALLEVIIRRYGSWNEFKEKETSEDIRHKKSYTKDRILFLLKKWTKKNGRLPATTDFEGAKDEYPSKQTVYWHFGSWNRALEMAGLGSGIDFRTVRYSRRSYEKRSEQATRATNTRWGNV